MLNQTGIKKVSGSAPVQILFNVQNQMSVSIIVDKTTASVDVNGRKIVKAGTPLAGDLTNRTVAFKAPDGTTTHAVGVLLHDVDITDDHANGTILIWGFVNLNRIDTTTQALIDEDAKTHLAGSVYFLKDN